MKKIPVKLPNRDEYVLAMVDDEDFQYLTKFEWVVSSSGYVATWISEERTYRYMHKMLLSEAAMVDHRNRNPLDNRRSNLRRRTPSQNNMNQRAHRDNSSGYRGVHYRSDVKKFRAQIKVDGKILNLGHFANKIDAALAYDHAAIKHFGEFANPNIIGKEEENGKD